MPLISYGISATSANLDNVTLSGAGIGVDARRSIVVRNSEFSGTSDALYSKRKIEIENSSIWGNNTGARAPKVFAVNATITGNDFSGVHARKLRATTSTISGNGGGIECTDAYGCADILTRSRPNLTDVTCETSLALYANSTPTGESWGACTLD